MIVICGFTPSELGITLASETYRPSRPCSFRSSSTTPADGVAVRARGAQRVEGHQREVAGLQRTGPRQRAEVAVLQRRHAGHRLQHRARAGGPVELGELLDPAAHPGDVVVAKAVADARTPGHLLDLAA